MTQSYTSLAIAFTCALLALTSVRGAAVANEIAPPGDFQVGPETFPIFPWDRLQGSKSACEEAKACGFNLAGFAGVGELDAVAAAGMKCFVTDTSIEIRGAEKLTDDEVNDRVKKLVARTAKHPAVFGYHLIDEPARALVPNVVRWAKAFQAEDPQHIAFTNLFPMSESADGSGKVEGEYESYLRGYLDPVKPAAFSFDHYSFFDDGNIRPLYFDCLEVARQASIKSNVPLWHVALANAHFHYAEPSPALFRFQIFTSLAYGVRGMGWFTYTARDRGNYRATAIDDFGHRTPTWDMLRDANLQLHRLAPHVTKLKSVNVFHDPDVPKGCRGIDQSRFVSGIKGTGPFCVGEFEGSGGKPAILIVNRSLTRSTQFTVTPKTKTTIQRVSSLTGQVRPMGAEDNWLPPGGGLLLLLHD